MYVVGDSDAQLPPLMYRDCECDCRAGYLIPKLFKPSLKFPGPSFARNSGDYTVLALAVVILTF